MRLALCPTDLCKESWLGRNRATGPIIGRVVYVTKNKVSRLYVPRSGHSSHRIDGRWL